MHTFTQDTPSMARNVFWNLSWSQDLQDLVNQAGILIEKKNLQFGFPLRWFVDKEYNTSGICQAAILVLYQDSKTISKREWNRYLSTYRSYMPLKGKRMGVSVFHDVRDKVQDVGEIIKEKADPELLQLTRFISTGRYKGKMNMIVIITIALLYFIDKHSIEDSVQG